MGWGRLPRYCCVNDRGCCRHALDDALFTQAQYAAWEGRCRGTAERPGCGQMLVAGLPDDRRVRWVAAATAVLLVLAAAGAFLRIHVFPPPLTGVAFASDRSRIDDRAGQVLIEVRRIAQGAEPVQVRVAFVDGNASAGVDYQVPGKAITLQPGEAQARIAVPILPDTTLRKGERQFSVVLENVANQPRHLVVIAPKPVDADAQAHLDQMVLGASRIAADIAGFVVKTETMERLLNDLRGRKEEFQEFRNQMRDAGDNLVRAREAYLQALRGLQTQAPQHVLAALDRLEADLRQRNFRQQSRVVPVLGRHYQELMQGKTTNMDRWTQELGRTVDRVPDARKSTAL